MKEGEPTTKIVRSLRNGQVTIPAQFRKQLGIADDSLLQVTLSQGELRIKPVRATEQSSGTPWLKELYERFAPVRKEAAQATEAEINAAIDQAVRSVRRRHA